MSIESTKPLPIEIDVYLVVYTSSAGTGIYLFRTYEQAVENIKDYILSNYGEEDEEDDIAEDDEEGVPDLDGYDHSDLIDLWNEHTNYQESIALEKRQLAL